MLYQQGDVLVRKVEHIKGNKLNHLILAEGEITGHCHKITEGDAELFEDNGILYLRVNSEEAILTHQEHHKITLPKGEYQISRVKEADHYSDEVRDVQD